MIKNDEVAKNISNIPIILFNPSPSTMYLSGTVVFILCANKHCMQGRVNLTKIRQHNRLAYINFESHRLSIYVTNIPIFLIYIYFPKP